MLDRLADEPTLLHLNEAARRISTLRETLGRVSLRLACLSSFTIEPLKPAIELQALRTGIALETYVGPFGQFEQELINPLSGLAAHQPGAVLLAIRLRDVCPDIYNAFNSLSTDQAREIVDAWFERLAAALRAYRERSTTPVLLQNYDQPVVPAAGIAEASVAHSQTAVIRSANDRLLELAKQIPNTYVLDYDALVARVGREGWCDDRMRFFARIPVASRHYWRLAGFYVKHLVPLLGLSKKVLVLDADNTIWGGVVGDVGIHGIQLGHDFPGSAFVEFQQRVLDLHQRGVILAIASKNEPGSVEQVLAEHSEMILRPRHFAAMRVNWKPKPENLIEIAAELNLGIDSFVFIDDSPVECDLVRKTLPDVLTIQLPADPAGYSRVIESLDCFEQWSISDEDRRRGEMYRAEFERKQLQSAAIDMHSFYRQLEMRLTLHVNHLPHVSRAAQLANRTNQFNMHTSRRTEDDIRRLMTDGRHLVVTAALADRFGDNGVIGLAVAEKGQPDWRLPMFLMSCRVLGRTIEQFLVRWMADEARAGGATRLVAEFLPTARNKPFEAFYSKCGFMPCGQTGDIQLLELHLGAAGETHPDWINLIVVRDVGA